MNDNNTPENEKDSQTENPALDNINSIDNTDTAKQQGVSSQASSAFSPDQAGEPAQDPMQQQASADPKVHVPMKKTKRMLIILIACIAAITFLAVAALLSAAHAQEEEVSAAQTQVPRIHESKPDSSRGDAPPSDAAGTTDKNGETGAAGTTSKNKSGTKSAKGATTVLSAEKIAQEITLPAKNGKNQLSDKASNKYIAAVVKKYGADPKRLVAIYSVPDTGNNLVLEFSSESNKSADTLVKVYQIDKDGGIKVATGKRTGNVGVSYYEGVLVIEAVKDLIIPQNSNYFTKS